ncbi:class I SAM-dependent methyltransferase [Methylomonas sp. SURF-1]|uniref:Class I SAM-dependent methyltransferase n=1 Tax=Methylomonas aurea TaxID=2952224 RepID=A0ABT1UCN1_9GAMM|nr:class I SAM-dependent methyltransferase [Methylomonas sp. SURF-1]MCQ8179979.1 class I SAM-dependent methyltransferase [Methylomonas sp. SURF-1]
MTTFLNKCRICDSIDTHTTYTCHEMMFGTGEEFEYFQCAACECLQIKTIPNNIEKYYPSNYTPHIPPATASNGSSWITHILQKKRIETAIFQRNFKLNNLIKHFVNLPDALHGTPNDVSSVGRILTTAGLKSFKDPILDVGCGIYSHWLTHLRELGFSRLLGIDPLIPKDQEYGDIKIIKKELCDVPGKFTFITLHHSLEHIPNQEETLAEIKNHLTLDGVCLIRIPLVSSYVWNQYKTNWVELDPPRHLYLHSIKSFKFLASKVGLEIFDIQYDTTAFEFYGSEMYARGIPLNDKNSPLVNINSSLFSEDEMHKFKVLSDYVNKTEQAGRAAIFLRRVSDVNT